jgi:hypothetical protein
VSHPQAPEKTEPEHKNREFKRHGHPWKRTNRMPGSVACEKRSTHTQLPRGVSTPATAMMARFGVWDFAGFLAVKHTRGPPYIFADEWRAVMTKVEVRDAPPTRLTKARLEDAISASATPETRHLRFGPYRALTRVAG